MKYNVQNEDNNYNQHKSYTSNIKTLKHIHDFNIMLLLYYVCSNLDLPDNTS